MDKDTPLARARERMKDWPGSIDEARRLHEAHEREQERARPWQARNASLVIIAVVVSVLILLGVLLNI